LTAGRPIDTIILTGVAGSGKTTVGTELARRLGWAFCDADDLHAPESIERISRNQPLDDADRAPWLKRVRAVIERTKAAGGQIVIACSALKQRYRNTLAGGLTGIRFVFLTGDAALLRQRLERRRGHFAGPALLESQLAELEPPRDALSVDVSLPVDAIVDLIVNDLNRFP
jgi:carbohydrate kinase (thermoresistant glucokinase family)